MDIIIGIFIYILIWWVALFAVLPWGNNKPPENPGEGHASSAPETPYLKQKFIATTIVAAILWLPAYLSVDNYLSEIRTVAAKNHTDDTQ